MNPHIKYIYAVHCSTCACTFDTLCMKYIFFSFSWIVVLHGFMVSWVDFVITFRHVLGPRFSFWIMNFFRFIENKTILMNRELNKVLHTIHYVYNTHIPEAMNTIHELHYNGSKKKKCISWWWKLNTFAIQQDIV